MNKPISMLINETRFNILQICNQSNLHPSILELIIIEIHNEIIVYSDNQSKMEQEKYEYMKNENKEELTSEENRNM